jgi:very-short-patch-repair endonuclease
MQPVELLGQRGGVAHLDDLRSVSYRALRASVSRGDIVRIRNAWYCLPGRDEEALAQAIRIGGLPTCVSAVADLPGVWLPTDGRLHIALRHDANHLRAPLDRHHPFSRSQAVVHHTDPWAAARTELPMSVHLASLAACLPFADAVVAVDSLLNGGHATMRDVERARLAVPRYRMPVLDAVDPRAQSGLESKARLALRRLGIRFAPQVWIPGVGRVDILIGDRLVLELDGKRWHSSPEAFETDRGRDLALLERGFEVIRVSYRQVMEEWPRIEAAIRDRIARRAHRWSRHVA